MTPGERALLHRILLLEKRLGAFIGGGATVTPHATQHEDGGSDELDLSGLSGTLTNATGLPLTTGVTGVLPRANGGVLASAATVATDQSTTSTSYTDLATSGPAVTLTTGATVIVWISGVAYKTTAGNSCWISVAVSGATTTAASDTNAVQSSSYNASTPALPMARVLVLTVTPGSNTFTVKYRVDGGTFNFFNRSIAVLALP